jgi:homoserine O-succinyltransferase
MNMQHQGAGIAQLHSARASQRRRSLRQPIVIGLVNNMPDAALRSTERQFCSLLSAASRDVVVRLKLFAIPEIPREPALQAHIARYYEDFAEIEGAGLDGLIVTGAEPRTRRLEDEAAWPALCRLADWVRDGDVSSIWSCLAAHAAALRLDGVERRALGAKLSGVFECQIDSAAHEIVGGTPDRWRVPHSRMYGLGEDDVLRAGYQILSRGDRTGPDIFMRRGQVLSLFFQGHPEYGPAALIGEYKRDVARFLDAVRDRHPDIPHGCFGDHLTERLEEMRARAEHGPRFGLLDDLTRLLAGAAQQNSWAPTAVRLYENWLTHLQEKRSRAMQPRSAVRPAERLEHNAA